MVYIAWDITYKCNYHCPYCFNRPRPLFRREINPLKAIGNIPESSSILLSGGEPGMHPGFISLCNALENHILRVNTNLSFDIAPIIGKKIQFICSFHPAQADINEFIGKASMLKNAGHEIRIVMVYHPAADFSKHASVFRDHGLDLLPKVFRGQHDGKMYPASYNEDDLKFLKKNGYYPDNMLLVHNHREVCSAGFRQLYIDPYGDIYRCPGARKPLGNIARGFASMKGPSQCKEKVCYCQKFPLTL